MDETAFLARLSHPRTGERAAHPGSYRAPATPAIWDRFRRSLESVGGSAHALIDRSQLVDTVAMVIELGAHHQVVASQRASQLLGPVPGVVAAVADQPPSAHQHVDLAIVVPELGVCENAAILLSAASLPERSLLFLAQHVLVLLDVACLVGDLHDGYARMPYGRAGAPLPHHLTWVSGPSKTADIEQTLVIGAHGCRSLVVLPYTTP